MRQSFWSLKRVKPLVTTLLFALAATEAAHAKTDPYLSDAANRVPTSSTAPRIAPASYSPWLLDVAITNLGTLGETPWINASNQSMQIKRGSFLDIYNFSLGSLTSLAANAISGALSFGANPILNIDNLKVELIDSRNRTVASAFGPSISLPGTYGTGNYRFQVSGIANGSAGGNYMFSVAAVPEASEWAMMLAGLVLVSYAVRRREKK